jgi:TPR repeat protein
VQLQVGSGFSGECVRTGRLLRCDDTELDPRVDREICRVLGIRSILAVPVRAGEKSIGLLEAFSALPNAFAEADSVVLQRLADTTLAAVNRAARAENLPAIGAAEAASEATRFGPALGSVLFASEPAKAQTSASAKAEAEAKNASGITLPRSHLLILICAFAMVFLALGYNLAPWIQSKIPQRGNVHLQTVLASSQPPKPEATAVPVSPSIETATFPQLREMAEKGDPAAENAVGLRYFQGDDKNGIPQDEKEAFLWFERAADLGNLSAQSKLAFLYWSGRGVPKDLNRAYFWTVLARARGDQGNKDLAAVLASRMTRNQTADIEQQANLWLQQHAQTAKPAAGH